MCDPVKDPKSYLFRIARETQRLAQKVFKCSKYEVMSALRLVLSPGRSISISDTFSFYTDLNSKMQ